MVYIQVTGQARTAQAQACVDTVENDSCTVTRGRAQLKPDGTR